MQNTHPVTADKWRGQLNFERSCTSTEPQDRCGLISELTSWNRVLYELNYELAETCPGKLRIRYVPYRAPMESRKTAEAEAAFLISWLVENHRCIDAVAICCTVMPEDATSELVSIRLRPPSAAGIRCLSVDVCDPFPSYRWSFRWFLEDMDALSGIEELRIRCCDTRFEPALVKLLLRNVDSLRLVELVVRKLSSRMVDAIQHLVKCEHLAVLVCLDHFGYVAWGTRTTTQLLRSLPNVKEFRLLPSISANSSISALSGILRSNPILTALEMHMYGARSSAGEFFAALGVNTTVKTLFIAAHSFDARCGQFLASALSRNTSMRDLKLGGDVTEDCMKSMVPALSQNTSLETLQFSCMPNINGILALCDVLRSNTTLKKVVFPAFRASQTQREALAKKLAHGEGYSRVLMAPLVELDLSALSTCLSSPTAYPGTLGRIDIRNVPDDKLKPFLDALASSNSRVQMLGFIIGEKPPPPTDALWKALRESRSIRALDIEMRSGHRHFLPELVDVFEANRGISEVAIAINELDAETASVVSHFLAVNRTVTLFHLLITGAGYDSSLERFKEQLSAAIAMNPVVVKFKVGMLHDFHFPTYAIDETLRRNWSTLNRAVDFVLLRREDRRDAEAFEIFSETSYLLDQVVKTSGQSELDARRAIASAENFRPRNYFVITGVVRHSVVCYPSYGDAMQCDDLNGDCWRAILRYLKVSDVLG